MSLSSIEKSVISHSESKPNEEVCGLILKHPSGEVLIEKVQNTHSDKENGFYMPQSLLIKHLISKTILGIYHSHPKSSEKPSVIDVKMSEEICLPYLIYSLKTKKFFLYFPESYEPDELIGRSYVKGFNECSCIFKDYFQKILGINITKWNKNYWLPEKDKEANDLLLKILDKNLKKVKTIKEHDVIVFEVKKNARLHIGIYLGDDFFMHQPKQQLSQKQILDERWQSKIKYLYRYR